MKKLQPFHFVLMRKGSLPAQALSPLYWDQKSPYQEFMASNYGYLQSFSQNPLLRQGLALSSKSLLDRMDQLLQKQPHQFRKKEQQTVRTLLQYLCRMTLKTSPFSTFTTLALAELGNDFQFHLHPDSTSRYRANHQILIYLWEWLLTDPSFYLQIRLCCNETMHKKGDEWNYLLNTRNVESFQSLENTETIELVRQIISESPGPLRFLDLIKSLSEYIDADEASLQLFLLELVGFGFLDWECQVNASDPEAFTLFIAFLKRLSPCKGLEEAVAILTFFETHFHHHKENTGQQNTSHFVHNLQKGWELLNAFDALYVASENEENLSADQFRRFQPENLPFRPENLVFEDVVQQGIMTLPESELQPLLIATRNTLRAVYPISKQLLYSELTAWFLLHYSPDQEVSFIQFYGDYVRQNAEKEEVAKEIIDPDFILFLKQLDGVGERDALHFQSESLLAWHPDIPDHLPLPQGAMLQLWKSDRQWNGVINASFPGYGKNWGRFFHLFPDAVYEAQVKFNRQNENYNQWVENTDASVFNANLHPPLVDREIRIPGGQNQAPPEQQIALLDLSVCYDPIQSRLYLKNLKKGDRLEILDLGLEAPDSRSPLFRFLNSFGPVSHSHRIFNKAINQCYPLSSELICFLPRIIVDDCLITQRKTWLIPPVFLPMRLKNENPEAYFFKLRNWIFQNDLPQSFFYAIKAIQSDMKDVHLTQRAYSKPQFFHADAPLLVDLFSRQIQKAAAGILITEMLPDTSQLLSDASGAYASEFVFQWK